MRSSAKLSLFALGLAIGMALAGCTHAPAPPPGPSHLTYSTGVAQRVSPIENPALFADISARLVLYDDGPCHYSGSIAAPESNAMFETSRCQWVGYVEAGRLYLEGEMNMVLTPPGTTITQPFHLILYADEAGSFGTLRIETGEQADRDVYLYIEQP